jgi:hypothetical protein
VEDQRVLYEENKKKKGTKPKKGEELMDFDETTI